MSSQFLFEHLKAELYKVLSRQLKTNIPASAWSRFQYNQASKFITDSLKTNEAFSNSQLSSLGSYISVSTIERIFKYGYKVPGQLDKRRLNTLDKLCIFLGYSGWFDLSNNQLIYTDEESIETLIREANAAEFKIYLNLPELDFSFLDKYYIPAQPAVNKIKTVATNCSKNNWVINIPDHPSYFKILDIQIANIQPDSIQVTTNELWYLKWFDKNTLENIKTYNKHNDQLYLLEKTADKWKIKLNHYPATL